MSCRVVSCHIVSCRVVSYRVMSCHVMHQHLIRGMHQRIWEEDGVDVDISIEQETRDDAAAAAADAAADDSNNDILTQQTHAMTQVITKLEQHMRETMIRIRTRIQARQEDNGETRRGMRM